MFVLIAAFLTWWVFVLESVASGPENTEPVSVLHCAVLVLGVCEHVALFWQELEFRDLTAVLHCIHSFMAAKVASVDPAFMDSQSIAGRYMHSS